MNTWQLTKRVKIVFFVLVSVGIALSLGGVGIILTQPWYIGYDEVFNSFVSTGAILLCIGIFLTFLPSRKMWGNEAQGAICFVLYLPFGIVLGMAMGGEFFGGLISGLVVSIGGWFIGWVLENWATKETAHKNSVQQEAHTIQTKVQTGTRIISEHIRHTHNMIDAASRYGVEFSSELSELSRIDQEVKNLATSVEPIIRMEIVQRIQQLHLIDAQVSQLKYELEEEEVTLKEKIKLGENRYKWVVELGVISKQQSITPEVLGGVNEIYAKWIELNDDDSLDVRLKSLGDDIKELKRIEEQYEMLSKDEYSAGKRASLELEKVRNTLRAKIDEESRLEDLQKEQVKNIKELENHAKLYVLGALAGKASVPAEQVVKEAEALQRKLREAVRNVLTKTKSDELREDSIEGTDEAHLHSSTSEKATVLDNSVKLHVPSFMDFDSIAEIIVEIENNSKETLWDMSLNFSDLKEFFDVDGTVNYSTVKPGTKLLNRVRIHAKKGIEGTIPVSIALIGNGITIEKEFTIKVGGTEIY
jgi:hypothetical protein